MKKSFLIPIALLCAVMVSAQSLQDSVQLSAFMDGIIQTHLRDKHLAGAVVSVVKDGKILLARGYGFADEKKQIKSTDSTLFRVGSISKLFVWISVMQLVHEGKLSLDADINQYLKDFKIPQAYSRPITLKDLMTHTAGFEDLVIGLFSKDSTALKPLGQILSHELPARVRAPGTSASYSNHGAGMAAYIVEQVSGMRFNDYVENHILNPLRMHATTFRQPLPKYLRPMMSKGYAFKNGDWVEQPFEFVPLYPVGAASTTPNDMSNFMNMILNHGKFKGIQIIDSATLALMETPAHRHQKDVNPMRYGFIDMSRNGTEVFGHGGDTFWFHSMMALFPEINAGLFVSFNTSEAPPDDVMDAFMDRYLPERNKLKPPVHTSAKILARFAGDYRVNRFPRHDITTISALFGDVTVGVVDSTKIKTSGFGQTKYYVPIDTLTFREEHSSDVIAFKQDGQGKIIQLFLGPLPILALDRTTKFNNAALHKSIFGVMVLLIIVALFYWPITSRARKGYEPMGSIVPLPPGAKVVGWFNYFLWALFYIGFVIILQEPETIVYGVPVSMKVLLVIPFLIALTTFVMFLQLYRIWNHRYVLWSRIYYFILTIMSTAALWQLYYWNLLGFRY